jgi:hypothetical protein
MGGDGIRELVPAQDVDRTRDGRARTLNDTRRREKGDDEAQNRDT